MTVIAFVPETNSVYADQRHTWSDGLTRTASKVCHIGDFIFAGAGDLNIDILAALMCRADLSNPEIGLVELTPAEGAAAGGAELLCKSKSTDRVYYVTTHGKNDLMLVMTSFLPAGISIGSGAPYYRAALASGKTPLEAMEIATRTCNTCGGGIDVF